MIAQCGKKGNEDSKGAVDRTSKRSMRCGNEECERGVENQVGEVWVQKMAESKVDC